MSFTYFDGTEAGGRDPSEHGTATAHSCIMSGTYLSGTHLDEARL